MPTGAIDPPPSIFLEVITRGRSRTAETALTASPCLPLPDQRVGHVVSASRSQYRAAAWCRLDSGLPRPLGSRSWLLMSKILKPCLVCGTPSNGPRCSEHALPDKRPSRARRATIGGSEQARLRRKVLARDSFACRWCGVVDRSGRILEVDHITPLHLGGDNSMENLQALCRVCHSTKSKAEQSAAADARRQARREASRFF